MDRRKKRYKDNEIILNICNNREFSNPEIAALDHMLSDEAWQEYLDNKAYEDDNID
jgi:hypothetical protein